MVGDYLYTKGQPDPDIMIRTSGELRLSNFLLWQLAYTEFVFLNKYWPDFNEKDLDNAVEDFQKDIGILEQTKKKGKIIMNYKRVLSGVILFQ